MEIIQINSHHATAATVTIARTLNTLGPSIALVQEPWTCAKKTVLGLNQSDFVTGDLCAAKLTINSRDIILASAYFPGDTDEYPPRLVEQLIVYAKYNKLEVILGCDANPHHTVWGSSNINKRD